MICIFDCESIPDTTLIKSNLGLEGSELELCEQAFKLQEEKTNSSFLPVPFHKVVSICAVITDDYGVFQKVSCIDGDDEKALIKNFLDFINKKNPKLVSFNGRSFDMPMLLVRAMKYSLTVPAYFETNNTELNKTKWDNYRYRFSDRFHVDLCDHISEFGAVRGMKLDLLCTMMGIPGKFDISGDQVYKLFFDGQIDTIKEYCQSDVLNTYWLYLKYELLRGNMLKDDYIEALMIFSEKLPHDKSYSDIFQEAIQEEIDNHVSDS